MEHKILASLAVFDYSGNKLCDLYDSQNNLDGQAFNIEFETNISDGIKKLEFRIPYMIGDDKNFRWQYLKSEYLIRLIYHNSTEWYIAQKPQKAKSKDGIIGEVDCAGLEASLKTKNIYMEFDDENGIGTVGELADKVLAGTGWHRGHTDPMLEADGVTEKIRSISSGGKQGALGLISTLCNLFRCYPIYKTDTKTVELYNYNNRDQVIECVVGQNIDSLTVKYDSSDIITRMYVEGEYGDDGYIGIDSVNPTGLNYIMNFDYFREIGVFTAEHEAALATYITNISDVKARITANTVLINSTSNEINNIIGQCKMVLYYVSSGFEHPVAVHGDPTAAQQALAIGDKVLVLNSDKTFVYRTIETTPAALIQEDDYGIAKFITPAAGSFGACEVQDEAKRKTIDELQKKIDHETKEDKIYEYRMEQADLWGEIENIYAKMYNETYDLMKPEGYLDTLGELNSIAAALSLEQDDIESDFIIAMGDMLRDGYRNDQNYIEGQEQHLYDDSVEIMSKMCRPSVTYTFDLIRLTKEFGVPLEDIKLNAIIRVHDDELNIHDNLFISKIKLGVDDESYGKVDVSNKDITLNTNDLGALLSRMSQLADLIDQKQTLYNRSQAILKNGTIFVDRLNGQIDVVKNQLLSTVSNWHTDDQGNILFESADGGSAMMLCGAGFMIANSKDENGNWNWRTKMYHWFSSQKCGIITN